MSELERIIQLRSERLDLNKPCGGPFYWSLLKAEQKEVYSEWFADTATRRMIGELSAAGTGFIVGLILGNGLTRIVQCGQFAGYSSLILGWLLKNQGLGGRLASIDVDQTMDRYAANWLARGGLNTTVKSLVADSSDPWAAKNCADFLGGSPQLVFIDSSHQYHHTLRELDLWAECISPGGFIVLHDVSSYARSFDYNDEGGVQEAVQEWLSRHREIEAILIDPGSIGVEGVYRDHCGIGLLHVRKPVTRSSAKPSEQRIVVDPTLVHYQDWQLGKGWNWTGLGALKTPGTSSSIDAIAPILAGERYQVSVTLADVISGGVHPGAGASPLADFFGTDGNHTCEIIAGSENARIGLLASANFAGRVLRMDARHISRST